MAASVVLRPAVEPSTSTEPRSAPTAPTRAPEPGSWTMYIRGSRAAPELYFYMGDPDARVVHPFHRTGR
ncbi:MULTISPECIES: hypothetical protein [unclassified Embleya]|uniref:hypothetical protein n=1 Tax=unclassified Embleya TaxID=2699296 RepID=UPI0036CF2AFB